MFQVEAVGETLGEQFEGFGGQVGIGEGEFVEVEIGGFQEAFGEPVGAVDGEGGVGEGEVFQEGEGGEERSAVFGVVEEDFFCEAGVLEEEFFDTHFWIFFEDLLAEYVIEYFWFGNVETFQINDLSLFNSS